MEKYTELTGLYSLTKTLRFELIPIGKTLEHIKQKGLIEQDCVRAGEYEKVKNIIDEYHKGFIKDCLENLKLKFSSDGKNDSLEDYVELASNSSRTVKEEPQFRRLRHFSA